jgi:glycine dehydrogenase subunit 1
LAELGRQCASKAAYAAERLTELPGVELLHPDAPFFKEFALRLPRAATDVVSALLPKGFLAGVPFAAAGEDVLLVAVTERRTREQIDDLAEAMGAVLA